jgi:hypothetical protein
MLSDRQTQKLQLKVAERRKVLAELERLAADIGRCEKSIASVMADLTAVTAKYGGQRTTREDVEYLTVLLDCAKRKLVWEKQIASLQKRAPELLESMSKVMNDRDYPPNEEMKTQMLQSLQVVQSALERLQQL